jgi:uncharacterized protein RhaS with RHS repeats
LHYNFQRYYDPDTGRYITADPIGLNGGINLYAYVLNDPVNWVDPWGLWGGKEEITQSPGMVDRIRDSIRTDFDRVVNPSRYGENARVNTVGQYAGTAIITGTIGSATAWRYGLQYSPYIGTFIGEAAFDYWGTGQPGWFALLDEIRSWLERLNNWREKNCANN